MDEVKSQDSDSDMEVEQFHNSMKSDSQNPVQENKNFDWLNDLHKSQSKDDLNPVVLRTTDWISELNTWLEAHFMFFFVDDCVGML